MGKSKQGRHRMRLMQPQTNAASSSSTLAGPLGCSRAQMGRRPIPAFFTTISARKRVSTTLRARLSSRTHGISSHFENGEKPHPGRRVELRVLCPRRRPTMLQHCIMKFKQPFRYLHIVVSSTCLRLERPEGPEDRSAMLYTNTRT